MRTIHAISLLPVAYNDYQDERLLLLVAGIVL